MLMKRSTPQPETAKTPRGGTINGKLAQIRKLNRLRHGFRDIQKSVMIIKMMAEATPILPRLQRSLFFFFLLKWLFDAEISE